MWTRFMDMHSGGGRKLDWEYVYIEAPEAEARSVFYNRFGSSPARVSCTCCGDDYSVSESPNLAVATGHERNCHPLETPYADGRYTPPDDPWFREHYYVEPQDEAEAERRGFVVDRRWSRGRGYVSLKDYLKRKEVHVIHASDIKPEERTVTVPEQGYVWVD